MAYLKRYDIDIALLEEQLVPTDPALLEVSRYQDFVASRAAMLAEACNDYVSQRAQL
jgi:hypothetical protein